ncbi:unnamed protein product [Boreogadus saida]
MSGRTGEQRLGSSQRVGAGGEKGTPDLTHTAAAAHTASREPLCRKPSSPIGEEKDSSPMGTRTVEQADNNGTRTIEQADTNGIGNGLNAGNGSITCTKVDVDNS